MKLDFSRGKVTLVICPVDMRSGIDRLSQTARQVLGIDILQGNRFVVFVSRTLKLCKVIFADEAGVTMVVRRLHRGRFQQILASATEDVARPLTAKELEQYLDGEDILIKRKNLLKN